MSIWFMQYGKDGNIEGHDTFFYGTYHHVADRRIGEVTVTRPSPHLRMEVLVDAYDEEGATVIAKSAFLEMLDELEAWSQCDRPLHLDEDYGNFPDAGEG